MVGLKFMTIFDWAALPPALHTKAIHRSCLTFKEKQHHQGEDFKKKDFKDKQVRQEKKKGKQKAKRVLQDTSDES